VLIDQFPEDTFVFIDVESTDIPGPMQGLLNFALHFYRLDEKLRFESLDQYDFHICPEAYWTYKEDRYGLVNIKKALIHARKRKAQGEHNFTTLREMWIEDNESVILREEEVALLVKEIFRKYTPKSNPYKKLIPVGFKITYDFESFRYFLKRQRYPYLYAHMHPMLIEVASFAAAVLAFPTVCPDMNINKLAGTQNLKLSTLCKYFDIEVNEDLRHTANYDLFITLRLFEECINKLTRNRLW
jgi:hypothetical protein